MNAYLPCKVYSTSLLDCLLPAYQCSCSKGPDALSAFPHSQDKTRHRIYKWFCVVPNNHFRCCSPLTRPGGPLQHRQRLCQRLFRHCNVLLDLPIPDHTWGVRSLNCSVDVAVHAQKLADSISRWNLRDVFSATECQILECCACGHDRFCDRFERLEVSLEGFEAALIEV